MCIKNTFIIPSKISAFNSGSSRSARGFTMAELIIVIAILAVLIVYLVRNFGVRSDDAKIAMVANILSKDVPAALQAFVLENNGCSAPETNTANADTLTGRPNGYTASNENNGIKLLLDNGIPAGTPWINAVTTTTPSYTPAYTVWSAQFNPATVSTGFLEVVYPLVGVGEPERARTLLLSKLRNSSEIHSLDGVVATGGFNRPDIAIAPASSASATVDFVLRYACS